MPNQPGRDFRRGYGPNTSKEDLLRLLDDTAHQATALLWALEDVLECWEQDDPSLAPALAHADYAVAEAKAGRRIRMTADHDNA
jgi:hypothetical protein